MDNGQALMLLLAAPAAGSFLALLVDRLPRDEDWVRAPSACRACGARLRARDLVPVLSYLALLGRCRTCGTAIPQTTLLMELAATGLAGLTLIAGGPVWITALALWLLMALAVADWLWMRLPDQLTAALLATALGAAFAQGTWVTALAGGLIGAGSFLALRLGYRALRGREGLGLGDVKLMAGLGALVGPQTLPLLVLVAALLTLAGALMTRRTAADSALPFGTALCAAGFGLWLSGLWLF